MNNVMHIDQQCNSENTSSPTLAEETPSSPAAPMVFTVGQGSTPVLKIVSSVDGSAPHLIKVVPAVVSSSDGPQQAEGKVSGGTVMVHKMEDTQQTDGRVFSIMHKAPSVSTGAKPAFNNGQQRVHTLGALPQGRVIPASAAAAAAQKVQILSNVVVSKQNIVFNKTTLQAQRQIITTPLAQKQLNNNTSKTTIVGKPSQTVQQQKPNNIQQKSIKSITRPVVQPPKTIKTLAPQSPQSGYAAKQPGIKTLSPQMNSFNKQLQTVNKIMPVQNQRVGIKTLAPQRPSALPQKPNYIGKHATQAQKAQKGQPVVKRNQRTAVLSPCKYNNQKQGVLNTQSNLNQILTAQILQSLPSSGSRTALDSQFNTTKNYPLQSPTDDTSLSEDIGEEVKPDFSPNLSYLHQVVMLDHNYGAPPPPDSPPPVISRSSSVHQSPGAGSSNHNGALVSRNDRERDNIQTKRGRLTSASLDNRGPITTGPQNQDDDAASTISSEGGAPDDGDEGEETETAPEGEGDEDGITRCICDFDHDDGYMICCDVCSSWQHVDCMGLDRDHIPDKYSCVRCQPRRIDRQHARSIQQRKREEFARLGTVIVSSTTPASAPPPAPGPGSSGHHSDTSSDTSSESDSAQPRQPPALNNNVAKKRSAPVSVAGRRKSEPVRRAPLVHKRQQRRESTATASRRLTLKKREKKQVMKRKMKSRSSVDDSSQDSWPSTHNFGTNLLQLRQWIENYEEAVTNHYSPELRARITNMRANGQHGASGDKQDKKEEKDMKQAPPTAAQDVQVQKCRVGNQPLTGIKVVLASQSLAANTPVIELRGKYMLSTQHRQGSSGPGSGGLLTRQHSQRPGPFLFFYRLPKDGTEVCVDTRTYGNDARFIRRSCRPNAELRHLVEKGTLHLYIITTSSVDKNVELTLKHESHDLAAVAASPTTAMVPCGCGGAQQTCLLYAAHQHRTNGTENQEEEITHRKRRGRRASSPRITSPLSSPPLPSPNPPSHIPVIETPPALSTRRASSHQTRATSIQQQSSTVDSKDEDRDEATPKEVKDKKKKLTREERKMEAIMKAFERLEKAEQRKQEVQARQAQRRESDPPIGSQGPPSLGPSTPSTNTKVENGDNERESVRIRRKKRKGRSRTVSTNSQGMGRRRTRLNSTDSYMTSGDESSLLSPPLPLATPPEAPIDTQTKPQIEENTIEECLSPVRDKLLSNSGSQASDMSSPGQVNTAAGLLLALANGGAHQSINQDHKSPENDGNSSGSNSSLQSSPGTPLSSACLLVAAAVGPLEPGFKFPKTKKAIMNEWLNKSPELSTQVIEEPQTQSYDMYNSTNKSLATLVQAASLCDSPPQPFGVKTLPTGGQSSGNAKKRWLRQAISEECDSPCSPPGNQEMVAPPKKRRLARESLSSEQSFTPPTTPTMLVPPANSLDDEHYVNNDEEFYETPSNTLSDSSPPTLDESKRVELVYTATNQYHHELDSEATVLKEQHEFVVERSKLPATIIDPRLGRDPARHMNRAELLGTLEQTIKFYEDTITGPIAPSIPETPDQAPVIPEPLSPPPIVLPPPVEIPQLAPVQEMEEIPVIQQQPLIEPPAASPPPQPVRCPTPPTPVVAVKEKPQVIPQPKPEIITPAKRKLSISEYRQRKQQKVPDRCSSPILDRPLSPETPPQVASPAISSLTTATLSQAATILIKPRPRSRSASSSSTTSTLSSDEELTCGPGSSNGAPVEVGTEGVKAQGDGTVAVAFNSAPTAVERQRENVERLKKAFGLSIDDETRRLSSSTIREKNISPQPEKVLESKYTIDTKFSKLTKLIDNPVKVDTNNEAIETEQNYPKFEESTSFIPPFNNPVYPNSTQFTSFSSVIDSSPYEGRNPSPPPSELIKPNSGA